MARRKFGTEGCLPLFPTPSDWKAPSLSDLPDWSRADMLSIDTEFEDATLRELGCGARRGAKIAGISFMLGKGNAYYIPVRHPDGNVDNPDKALEYFRDMAPRFKGKLLGANITGDLDVMDVTEGIRFVYPQIEVIDVQVVDPLIMELFRSYSLENIGNRRNIPGKDKALLKKAAQDYGYDTTMKGWEKCIPKLPAKFVGPYAEHDVRCLPDIYASQLVDIEAQGLQKCVAMASKVLVILLKMRQRGVKIDFDQLDRVEQFASQEERRTNEEIRQLTKVDIGYGNCMSASRVAVALEAIGVTVPLTETGLPSVTTALLAEIDNPVAKKIRYLRESNKIRTTFVDSIRRYQTHGRIHTTFRQIVGANDKNETSGAAFGRLSCVNPNLQQQPSRGKFAKMWRSIYLPDDGGQWLSSDYSSVEPRWTTHFATLLGLPGAAELAREYNTNPKIDPHGAMAKIAYGDNYTDDDRKNGKFIVLGTTYGMGGSKLCKVYLKLPTRWLVQSKYTKHYFDTEAEAIAFRKQQKGGKWEIREVAGEEGQKVQDKFHEGAPFIKALVRKVIEKAESTGVLKLLGDRLIHFPMKKDGTYDWTYKAPNRLVQGSAGMHLQFALIAIEEAFPGFLQLTVHDEVCGTVDGIPQAHGIREVMVNVIKALVPFRCDLEIGPNWGEQHLICGVHNCPNMAIDKYGCELHK